MKPVSGWGRIMERYEWSRDNQAELRRGWIKRGETLRDLAAALGLDPAALEASVARWNRNTESGKDPDCGRRKMLVPIVKPPFYAVELSPSMLNTQGGPRRNERSQIVRPDGTPIPRLYSAGELGSIYGDLYQGTGNIGECLAFGRIAARNAVAEKAWG
jgi:succinate dehydrogenase/fumarate reductase flavoprotein subunit